MTSLYSLILNLIDNNPINGNCRKEFNEMMNKSLVKTHVTLIFKL